MTSEFSHVQEIETDVLIIGGVVAGMMAAAWSARGDSSIARARRSSSTRVQPYSPRAGHRSFHVFDEANSGASADVIKTFRNSGMDLKTSFLEVTSCPHTYLGGLRIDEWGRTTVDGLYAGGEAAGGIHGANRLGGAALIDSYVFGFRAGMTAACESRARDRARSDTWRPARSMRRRSAPT